MHANDTLATQVSEALHASEGATPIALDDIPGVSDSGESAVDHVAAQHNAVSSTSVTSHSLTPVSLPHLQFDGVTRDKFVALQNSDPSLAPLWQHAHNNSKSFFVANDMLMHLTSTANHVSHAPVVPQELRHKVLIAAHEGLGGGLNSTRALINKLFHS